MANDAKFNFYLNRQGPRGQKGEKGDPGFSPSITVNTDTADEYTLLIQNEYDNFVTDNIRPTYDDRGGTYVRVDKANNVQYFGSADIATTANYGEVKLAQASDLASTVDVGNSNVITVELLKTWFDGQLADNLVTTTNNVTIQGQKIFATPTRFMDTVRIGNRLLVTQEDTGTITFDSDKDGTLIGTHLTSTGDARFMKNVTVDGTATITGQLSVKESPLFYKSIDVTGRVYAGGITILSGDIEVNGDINATGHNTITKNVILSPGALKRVNGFSGNLRTDTSEITPEEYITVGDERLPLRLVGTKVLTNGKDVATTDTVEAIQSDLNIAKQDIIEAQGDIDNLQMNKQNKLTAGTGITIDADNVISATGGVVDIPIASSTTLGGIKVGENLTISEDGTLSATRSSTGDVIAAGNNTFTGENTFNGAVNLNGISTAENLTVTRNLTSNGEINAVSIKTTGLRSDDIQTTTNKKYLTEVDVDNQTIQVVGGKISSTTPITYLTRAQYDALGTKDANTMYVITDEEGGGGTSDIPIATTTTAGKVKPDGTTITITNDGTISAVGGGTTIDDSTTSSTSTWSSSKINSEINTVANQNTTLQQGTQFTLNLTGNGTLGGSTPACTGSSYETGHPYYYAFKGATSSTPTKELWGPSSKAENQYIILDCVTPIPLQSFRWTNGGNNDERFPTIVFKGSNDNSNYTTLGTYQTQNATDDSVTIENYTPYRYYRFDFPQPANWGKIGFISMSGFNRYNILNIGDGLDVINGQLTCTATVITGSCIPDYSAGVTFTRNADHIAPCDGVVLIFANLYSVAGGSCYMTINGVRLNTDMGGNSAGTYFLYFPVAKGDTYNWTDTSIANNNNYTFYPLKGAK